MMDVFLDSGAFSVWKKGMSVNIQDYIDFIHKYKHLINVYANLDDMNSPDKTWENQREMERQGLNPLPVYHIGEPYKYFKMALEYEYFAVGGVVFKGRGVLYRGLVDIFSTVCPASNNFMPTHKVHGFALTSPILAVTFPWYSVDSTSWVLYGKYGVILIPAELKNYGTVPYTIFVSTRSKAQSFADAHINTVSDMERDSVLDYVHRKGFQMGESEFFTAENGYTLQDNEYWVDRKNKKAERVIVPGLSNDHKIRDQFNLMYYLELEKSIPPWPWAWESKAMKSFFDSRQLLGDESGRGGENKSLFDSFGDLFGEAI